VLNLRLGGIPIVQATRKALAQRMVLDVSLARQAAAPQLPRIMLSANGDVIARAHHDPEYRRYLSVADFIAADGMPLVYISRLFYREPLPERVCTTDFVLDAVQTACDAALRFYLLGSTEENNRAACDWFAREFPKLQIAGSHDGYFARDEEAAICADVLDRKTDVLWVGMGSPRQERFCVENRERLRGVGWIVTCGGLFDYYSGRSKRAPIWMQKAALEWLFRMSLEPRRLFPRYARTNIPALYHLLTKSGPPTSNEVGF
jgi:N-acetylglucosaminyldiphosphoundecaprenol N-acetyl-beta-D-mannosaminyltransferase